MSEYEVLKLINEVASWCLCTKLESFDPRCGALPIARSQFPIIACVTKAVKYCGSFQETPSTAIAMCAVGIVSSRILTSLPIKSGLAPRGVPTAIGLALGFKSPKCFSASLTSSSCGMPPAPTRTIRSDL